VKAFKIQGRKASLTPTGELLYRRARYLLDEATGLEQAAKKLSAGWEAEIRVAVETISRPGCCSAALRASGRRARTRASS